MKSCGGWPVPGKIGYFERVFERALLLGLPIAVAQCVVQETHPYGFLYDALSISMFIILVVILTILAGSILKLTWELWE